MIGSAKGTWWAALSCRSPSVRDHDARGKVVAPDMETPVLAASPASRPPEADAVLATVRYASHAGMDEDIALPERVRKATTAAPETLDDFLALADFCRHAQRLAEGQGAWAASWCRDGTQARRSRRSWARTRRKARHCPSWPRHLLP